MSLSIINLSAVANQIGKPFAVEPLAVIGDLALSVYICQGQVNWHKHLDEDELFLVHEGVIGLETERGNLTLHSEELIVVPKGVAHRSGSALRSVVVLIRAALLSGRKNGERSYVLDTDPPLEKVRIARASSMLTTPYQPVALSRVEGFEVLLMAAQGFGPLEVAPKYGALWLVVRGSVGIEIGEAKGSAGAPAGASLEAGELTVVPAGMDYRLHAAQSALLLTLARTVQE
jgi:mannose-6-phosphate isomerase-like protein (cupin superfamily)